jgi:WD40 repeat protein
MAVVSSVTFSPDSKTLASADVFGNVVLWDVRTGARTATLQRFNRRGGEARINSVYSLAFRPDGSTLAAGTVHGIKLWDVKSVKSVGPVFGPSSTTTWAVAFHPDGKVLASAGSKRLIGQRDRIDGDETLHLWELIPSRRADR